MSFAQSRCVSAGGVPVAGFEGDKMRFRFSIVVLMLLALSLPSPQSSGAADWFFSHRQRARTKCALPKHDYNHNSWPFTTDRKFGATAIAVAATDADLKKTVKPFHFRATALTVQHLVLDQLGLSLDKNGRLYATGRFTHTGGDGGLIGANVTVRIRAYVAHTAAAAPAITTAADLPVATPNRVTRLPPDAYRVWSCERKFWVSRGRPQYVSLDNPGEPLGALRHHFDEITHLEVELEYERDR